MKLLKYTILSFVVLLSSCKGFLDLDSPNAVLEENVFTTAEGLRAARIGMYATMAHQDYYGGYYPLMASCYSDDGANGGYTAVALDEFGNQTLSADNIFLQNTWLAMYNTIAVSNKILTNVDNVSDATAEEKADIKAEALFVRALAHFDILRCWGEHWDMSSIFGIPNVRGSLGFDSRSTRASVKDNYDFIINDLYQAEQLLKNTNVDKNYITVDAVKALVARVCLYGKDAVTASKYANEVIEKGNELGLLDAADYGKIFSTRKTSESIFELGFNTQNRSAFNSLTYVRDEAIREEVAFLASEDLGKFFDTRTTDARSKLVKFKDNSPNMQPDGRTEKYRGEQTRDNPAYVIRLAEMYLIAAEAEGRAKGLDKLNTLRAKRGLSKITTVANDNDYQGLVLAERRAELNWEGHRYFDLARLGKVQDLVGKDVQANFPIPTREIVASSAIFQNKGY